MSTKKETTATNAYNPASMAGFNQLQNPLIQRLLSGMEGDQQGNLRLAQLFKGADASSQAEIQNLMRNRAYTGFGGASQSPYMASQLARQGRGNSSRRAQAQIQNMFLTEQMKQFYTQQAGAYNPLQTGGTQVQKSSGLGTWLPQVVGGALGFGMSGGFGKLFNKAGGAPTTGAYSTTGA